MPTTQGNPTMIGMRALARIAELKAEWSDSITEEDGSHPNPDDYGLSQDDWSVGLGDDGAAEIVALLALTEEPTS